MAKFPLINGGLLEYDKHVQFSSAFTQLMFFKDGFQRNPLKTYLVSSAKSVTTASNNIHKKLAFQETCHLSAFNELQLSSIDSKVGGRIEFLLSIKTL